MKLHVKHGIIQFEIETHEQVFVALFASLDDANLFLVAKEFHKIGEFHDKRGVFTEIWGKW